MVTTDRALVWTDGRYFLQAEQELDCNWELMKVTGNLCARCQVTAFRERALKFPPHLNEFMYKQCLLMPLLYYLSNVAVILKAQVLNHT